MKSNLQSNKLTKGSSFSVSPLNRKSKLTKKELKNNSITSTVSIMREEKEKVVVSSKEMETIIITNINKPNMNTKSIKSTNKLTDPKKQKKLKSRKKISQDLIDHRLV
jgi:hypothetical protein